MLETIFIFVSKKAVSFDAAWLRLFLVSKRHFLDGFRQCKYTDFS